MVWQRTHTKRVYTYAYVLRIAAECRVFCARPTQDSICLLTLGKALLSARIWHTGGRADGRTQIRTSPLLPRYIYGFIEKGKSNVPRPCKTASSGNLVQSLVLDIFAARKTKRSPGGAPAMPDGPPDTIPRTMR